MKSGAPSGIRNGNSKVPFEKIEQARKEWENRITLQKLADKYGVSIHTLTSWLRYNSRIEEFESKGATRSKLVGRISNIKLIGSSGDNSQHGQQSGQSSHSPANKPQQATQTRAPVEDFDDILPF